jgi:uncharacterized membrane protein YqaE (UPF0057 family)
VILAARRAGSADLRQGFAEAAASGGRRLWNAGGAAPTWKGPNDRITAMRLLLAILLPWLQFFTIGRPFAGIICLILQLTLIGWLPAAVWSVYALNQYSTDRKIEKALGQRNR